MNALKFLTPLIVASSLVSSVFGLGAGDAVTTDAVGKATFIQGTAPSVWEPGKVYMLECWATTCGPCIAFIPHINELHKKYADKGLRVIGLDVWEEELDKVEKFVKAKGDGMSYPVAYVGKGGAFEAEWLKPAGVKGIPHTFIVRDGKLLFTEHPMRITDALVEKLLAGGAAADEAIASLKQGQVERDKAMTLVAEFKAAWKAKDTATMAQKIEALEKIKEGTKYVPLMKVQLATQSEDWAALESALQSMPVEKSTPVQLENTTVAISNEKTPEKVRRALADKLEESLGAKPEPMSSLGLLKLLVSLGDKERANALVGKMQPGNLASEAILNRVKEGVEKGEVPSRADYTNWLIAEGKIQAPKPH